MEIRAEVSAENKGYPNSIVGCRHGQAAFGKRRFSGGEERGKKMKGKRKREKVTQEPQLY